MCRVKEGAAVNSNADLQNLVTSVILRQTSVFSASELCHTVREKLKGSSYLNSPEVEKKCKETISTLYSMNCLKNVESDKYKLSMSFPSVTGK